MPPVFFLNKPLLSVCAFFRVVVIISPLINLRSKLVSYKSSEKSFPQRKLFKVLLRSAVKYVRSVGSVDLLRTARICRLNENCKEILPQFPLIQQERNLSIEQMVKRNSCPANVHVVQV